MEVGAERQWATHWWGRLRRWPKLDAPHPCALRPTDGSKWTRWRRCRRPLAAGRRWTCSCCTAPAQQSGAQRRPHPRRPAHLLLSSAPPAAASALRLTVSCWLGSRSVDVWGLGGCSSGLQRGSSGGQRSAWQAALLSCSPAGALPVGGGPGAAHSRAAAAGAAPGL